MRKQKQECPDCGRLVAVTSNGLIYIHNTHASEGRPCLGSGKVPLSPQPAKLAEVFKEMAEGYEPVAPVLGPQVTIENAPGSQMPTRRALVAPGAVPSFRVGDRVVKKPDGPRGIVTALNTDGGVLVHWGSTTIRDHTGATVENRFEEWVLDRDLKLETEPVWVGDVEGVDKTQVWDPEASRDDTV